MHPIAKQSYSYHTFLQEDAPKYKYGAAEPPNLANLGVRRPVGAEPEVDEPFA